MLADLTQLEEEELTDFIALCDFSEDYLYNTELPVIIEDIYAKLDEYHNRRNIMPSDTLQ
jgi:hypothetical protein